ncbi:G5 domain-containing protein [Streptococcus suis]|uniref:GAG-binding domain-containing protein n=1 Tax=Streptococcus suis TaxID=1307 RepID=UPI0015530C94|nr:GAG-binding domain-containing protein [Streptococcus suis]MCB2886723.1 G5 domain-containing protein [Streptococcus suis]MCK4071421.1 YSIRK-type signal peptide-containing protein [Streptococcus suis]NQK71637.1 YSIRK-type signal peptide-containing protein [Streptococcus suis]HEM4157510.1 G5 domain-containing protein [Streptococcus suis]HEM4363822.1 G5 domain-containing protein [Streptococcus suis]
METANKKFRYSIRKFKVGVGSVLIATCLLGAGISTQTAFAMTEPSTATEPTKTPLQHLRELVEELKTDLEELEKLEKYEKSAYPTQDYLWTEFSSVGIKEMERVSSLKEEDSQIPDIDPLLDFGNHIKWERLTREVALYRKKYPNNKEIEEEYKQHLEQTEIKTYASQEGFNLKTSTNEAEQAVERIKKIVQELEAKAEEKTPETKEETPVPTPDAAPAPAPTPKEEDAPAPKEDEVPAPMPDAPAPKAEEEVPTPMPEAPAPKEEGIPAPMPEAPAPKTEEDTPTPAPAPKEDEVPAPTPMPDTPMDQPKTDKVESDKQMPEAKQPEMEQPKAEDMPKEEMPKSEQPKAEDSAPKTAVPEVAPKTAEKPKLDFTTKERKVEEALPIKEEIRYDASLPLGKSYLLQEGKAGKKVSVYQDVIVDGKVVVTNLLSETVVEGQNRILVKGSLEMKKEEVKTTPSVQSNPTLSHKGAPSANKATLPATGEQRNNLALVGLGLAGISLAVVATAINKKSKDQI